MRGVKLPEKVRAVVTGAGSGLGRALSLQLGKRGGRVLVLDIDSAKAEETATLVEREGGEASAMVCDVGKLEDVERAAVAIDQRWGGVDLLVNNAGVAASGLVGDVSLDTWEWIMRVNLWGVIHGCHVFVPRLKRQNAGFILNVASSAGIASLPEMGPYNVTKAGVISLSETLDAELAPHHVAVSVLCPTFFPTNLLETGRFAEPRQRKRAEAFFRRARTTADDVAREGLRGLEAGQLIIIPQRDGNAVWLAKRFAPALYHGFLRRQQKSGWLDKYL